MENKLSLKHHHCSVVGISTMCFWLCFWHLWKQTPGSVAFRWKILGEYPMAVCMQDLIWGRNGKQNTTCVTKYPLPGAAHPGHAPYAMVGDTAFPLKPYLMRPKPGQNLIHKRGFSITDSRARMVMIALGILASLWRSFHPVTLVVAACTLHNFLLAPTENVWLLKEVE